MSHLAGLVSRMTGLRRYGLAFMAGAISPLAMAPFGAWPILLLTLPVLVWLLDGCCLAPATPRRARVLSAAAVGWCFGFGYFLTGLYWVGHAFLVEAETFAWLLPFAVSLLPAGLALFFALATATACLMWRPGAARIVALAAALMATEWLRGHALTGFPWNTLGYAMTDGDAMMQWASLFGAYGLTLIAVLVCASPAAVWGPPAAVRGSLRRRLALPLIMAAVLAGGVLWGQQRLNAAVVEYVPGVRLRIVQPNIKQSEKWKPGNQDHVFQTYLAVSRNGAGGAEPLAGITHLIWPESAVPFLLAQTRPALDAIARLLPPGAVFITGAMRIEPEDIRAPDLKVYNSLYVMDDEANILATYDKLHLVPFGEYLPFQKTLEDLGLAQLTGVRGGFTAGRGSRLTHAPGLPPFLALICYEIIFPGEIDEPGARPQWMLNLTNDGWFGASIGPYQHLHQAQLRAVEEGLPVIRAANTGISAVIGPYGRVLDDLSLGTAGAIDTGLPRAAPATPYARWGLWIEGVLLISSVSVWFVLRRDRRA